jgi:hypothetical protein
MHVSTHSHLTAAAVVCLQLLQAHLQPIVPAAIAAAAAICPTAAAATILIITAGWQQSTARVKSLVVVVDLNLAAGAWLGPSVLRQAALHKRCSYNHVVRVVVAPKGWWLSGCAILLPEL